MADKLKEIEDNTRAGGEQIQQGNIQQAINAFTNAYNQALGLSDDTIQKTCAFNLGSVYVASQQAERGIKMLKKAIPNASSKPVVPHADLFHNLALAYELKGSKEDAINHFELSLEEYQRLHNKQMQAETASRLAHLYNQVENYLQAARSSAIAAKVYRALQKVDLVIVSLCQQATALVSAKKTRDALEVADDCMILCQKQPIADGDSTRSFQWKVYNELGLLYSQCRDFAKAATCFEFALPLCRDSDENENRHKSIIVQNLGAVYNSLGDYTRAVKYHRMATSLHAVLGNRGAEGHCYGNLAYALTQIGDIDGAEECYLHALQAARDTDDTHAQWQALEGLAAVAYNQGQLPEAVSLYKNAMSTLASSTENNTAAQNRLVTKLTSALQNQVQRPDVSILVNDKPRPPTRDEMRIMNAIRRGRVTTKVASEFEKIALGIGEYDSDSDLSIRRNKVKARRLKRARDAVDLTPVKSDNLRRTKSYERPKTVTKKNISRRISKSKHLHGDEPLLSLDYGDQRDPSDKVPRENGKKPTDSRTGDHPVPVKTSVDPPPNHQRRMPEAAQPPLSELKETSELSDSIPSPTDLATTEEHLHGYEDALRRMEENATDTETQLSESELTDTLTEDIPTETDTTPTESESTPNDSEPTPNGSESTPNSSEPTPTDNEGNPTEASQSELTPTDIESTEAQDSPSREVDSMKDASETLKSTMPSSGAPRPPGILVGTYEQPVDPIYERAEDVLDQKEAHNPSRRYSGRNFFKPEEDVEKATMRISVPNEENPDYMTIRTIQRRDVEPQPSTSNFDPHQAPPSPPPRNYDTAPHSKDQEAFLTEYEQKWSENTRDKVGRTEQKTDQGTSDRKQRKISRQMSKACVVM